MGRLPTKTAALTLKNEDDSLLNHFLVWLVKHLHLQSDNLISKLDVYHLCMLIVCANQLFEIEMLIVNTL